MAGALRAGGGVLVVCLAVVVGCSGSDDAGPLGSVPDSKGSEASTVTTMSRVSVPPVQVVTTPVPSGSSPTSVATTAPPVVTFAVTGGPEPILLPAADAPPSPRVVEASWSTPRPGSQIGDLAATAEVVALALTDEHVVVALDRATGVELWRRNVSPDATVFVRATLEGIVIDERDSSNTSTWTELDAAGNTRYATEFDQTSSAPRLDIRSDGLYQSTVFEGGAVRRTVIDPVAGIVETTTGVTYREQWDALVTVGTDGVVGVRRGLGTPVEPTGITLGAAVTSIALVGNAVVTYGDDELVAVSLDGTPLWSATYEGDGILTELFAVGPRSSRLAIVTPPDRLDIVDVDTAEVVLSTTLPGAAFPVSWPDRLVADVEPSGDGSVGLLDLLTGEVTVTPSVVGHLTADPASPWVQSTTDGQVSLVGLGAAGEPVWAIDVPTGGRLEPVPGGAVLVGAGATFAAMFEFPVTRPAG